jgi:hypothetical protein
MDESPLRRLAYPSTIHRRVPLPDDQNALVCWQAASAALVNHAEIDLLVGCYERECDCAQLDCPACNPMDVAEERQRVHAVLAQNAGALRVMEAGIAKGRMQAVMVPGNLDASLTCIQQVRGLARLKRLQAHAHFMDDDFAAATIAFCELLEMGRIYAAGEGLLVQFLVAVAVQGVAIAGMSKLIDEAHLTPENLHRLSDALDAAIGRRTLVATMQVEFSDWAMPILESLTSNQNGKQFLDHFLDVFYCNHALRREQIRFVLSDHPKLWDPTETTRAISRYFAIVIAELLNDSTALASLESEAELWNKRSAEFHRLWPEEFSSWVMPELLPEGPPATVAPQRLSGLRDELLRIEGPLGLLIAENLRPGISSTLPQMLNSELIAHLRTSISERIAAAS